MKDNADSLSLKGSKIGCDSAVHPALLTSFSIFVKDRCVSLCNKYDYVY